MHYTYLRVSLVLQVEQAKQLTHQALLRADTTDIKQKKRGGMRHSYAVWNHHMTKVTKSWCSLQIRVHISRQTSVQNTMNVTWNLGNINRFTQIGPLHYVFSNKTSFLTIAFDHTIAVVANISKQLRLTREDKNTVSNTVTRLAKGENNANNAELAVTAHMTCFVKKQTNKKNHNHNNHRLQIHF